MHARLIADAWRTPLACVSAAAVALLAVLGVLVHRASTSFDTWMFRELYNHIGAGPSSALLDLSTPALSIGLLGMVVVFAALLRRWNVAALAAIAPAVAVIITKYALKPHIGRRLTFGTFSVRGVFPSGHETAVSATAMVLLVVAFQVPMRRRTRAVIVGVLAVWTALAAIGLVRNFWHYATDTLGALCVSAAVVPVVAIAIDRYAARVERRPRTPATVS